MKPTRIALALATVAPACGASHPASPGAYTHPHSASNGGHTPAHHRRFDDAERWAREFESPERDATQRPDWVIAQLALQPDSIVADVGAGTGYFAVRLARAVPAGRVWAEDIEPSMVRYLQARARRESIANLRAVLGVAGDPLLPEPADLALIVNTYHHIDDRPAFFRTLCGYLRPGGRVAIVDFRRDAPVGPPAHARVSPDEVRRELTEAGYAFESAPEGLPHHYLLIFRAPAPQ